MLPGDSLMLGHSTLRLEDTFGETFTAPGEPLVLPSQTPLLDALRAVGTDLLSKPAGEKPLVKVNSDHAQKIYLHPFTQLAIERGRQRRAALESARGVGPVSAEESKDAFDAMAGIDTYRSDSYRSVDGHGVGDATGIDSTWEPPSAAPPTVRGVPALSGSGHFLPLRSPHALVGGERKVEEWSPRVLDGGPMGHASRGASAVGSSAPLRPASDAGRQLLHAALE